MARRRRTNITTISVTVKTRDFLKKNNREGENLEDTLLRLLKRDKK